MLIPEYKIRLSIQRALLDKITPNIRQISYAFEHDLIHLYFFYDCKPSEEEEELSGDIAAEVVADFPASCMIECSLQEIKYPAKINSKGSVVYSRFE